ncbi:MAG: hypothetical protein Q8N23_18715 [Archangium sp.]|nr:hypothetical protein [Archangium sp.]MDP3573608.1 hypothetical protein [Archangium sp.]
MKWLPLALLLIGCPERREPERGLQLVYKKPNAVPLRAAVDRRLAQLKLRANLSEDDHTLTVRVPEGGDLSRIKALFAQRGHLEFCPENATVAGKWCDEQWPAGVVVDSVGKTCSLLAADRSALEAALPDAGAEFAWGTSGGQASAFSITSCLSPRIVAAEVAKGQPGLMLDFDRAGARDFAALTSTTVGRRLIVRLDGVVASAPVVMEAITGGRAVLTTGEQQREDWEVLAAALVGGALPELELLREERWGPPSLRK